MPSIRNTTSLDLVDWKLLGLLSGNARRSWAELASSLGLSAPAVAERVRKLEERGVIKGYAAIVDPDAVGAEVGAFVAVRLERPKHRAPFLRRVKDLDGVLECHHVCGEDDYLLKVRVASMRALDELVSVGLKSLDGVAMTRTTVVMSTLKETPTPPLAGG